MQVTKKYTYITESYSLIFGEVQPRISPGDRGFAWGIWTVQYEVNSCLATYDKKLMALIAPLTNYMDRKISFGLKILDSHQKTASQTKITNKKNDDEDDDELFSSHGWL